MRILMLGWEFPPFIAGGLGTACYGLTRALDQLGHEVIFVLPRPVSGATAAHVTLKSPQPTGAPAAAAGSPDPANARPGAAAPGRDDTAHGIAPLGARSMLRAPVAVTARELAGTFAMPGFDHASFLTVPATFSSPYRPFTGPAAGAGHGPAFAALGPALGAPDEAAPAPGDPVPAAIAPGASASGHAGAGPGTQWVRAGEELIGLSASAAPSAAGHGYGTDMIGDAERYARLVVAMCRQERMDVIHAHDWMTFPAGLALAQVTGKPLVVHVHSTEFDRSGEHPDQRVYDIERRGMHGALRVICVSRLTASICTRRYGVRAEKIDVVWNGIDSPAGTPAPGRGSTSATASCSSWAGSPCRRGPSTSSPPPS
ncbi:MAG TPA: glycosyltransferase, partial [Phycisphaerales bacterium]|nr:glycosyltransferase [Phycisphaerales bacterium]